MNNHDFYYTWRDMPAWEYELYRDATRTATREARYIASDRERPSGEPGDWIPYGRCPLALIPDTEYEPEVYLGWPQTQRRRMEARL